MITRTAHIGFYVVRSPDNLEYKNKLVAQLYTGKSLKVGDCLEEISLPSSEKCGTYLDFGKTVLDRVAYTFTRANRQEPQLIVFHPGLKYDAESVSENQLCRIARGAVESLINSRFKCSFLIDETPVRLG